MWWWPKFIGVAGFIGQFQAVNDDVPIVVNQQARLIAVPINNGPVARSISTYEDGRLPMMARMGKRPKTDGCNML